MILNQLSKSEGQRLLSTYKKSEKKIKAKLKAALSKGNNPEYLRRAQRSINQEIKTLEQQFNNYSQKRLPLIYNQGLKITDQSIDKFENTFDLENSFGKVDRSRLMIIADNTQRGLSGITTVIGRQSADYLRRIGLMTTRDIVIGSETWLSASKMMTKELQNKGFFYVDYKLKNGKVRKVPADVYSRMVARTTSAEVARLSTTDRITSRGYDLVVVIGISRFPESPCVPFQGKTLSISGQTEGYTALESARADGFNHPNCLIPDTEIISDRIITSYTRWYEGEVVVIRTANGNKLTVTPNHPILTRSGWVEAKLLSPLDEVIECIDSDNLIVTDTNPYNKKVKAVIQDIVSSFCEPSQMLTVSVPTTSEDFHCDVTNGKVCVVNSDVSLLGKLNTVFSQEFCKSPFVFRNISEILGVCFSSSYFAFVCISLAFSAFICFLCNLFASFIAHKRISKFNTFLLRACTWYSAICKHILNYGQINAKRMGNTAFAFAASKSLKADSGSNSLATFGTFEFQEVNGFINSMTRYSETLSEFFLRASKSIRTDKIVSVEIKSYRGQVYNLHTLSGYYVANNILTHNCIHSLGFSEENLKYVH